MGEMERDAICDQIEESTNIKISDRQAFVDSVTQLVNAAASEHSGEESEENRGPRSEKGKPPSIALILGKMKEK